METMEQMKRENLPNLLSETKRKARRDRYRVGFGEVLVQHMDEKGFSSMTLAPLTGMSDRTIRRMMYEEEYTPTREMVMAVCVALKLDLYDSLHLMKLSSYRLREDSPVDAIYLKILEHEGEYSVAEWNRALREIGMSPIGAGRSIPEKEIREKEHGDMER